MYSRQESIPIKDTPSFSQDNLSVSIRKTGNGRYVYKYAYVSKNTVNLLIIDSDESGENYNDESSVSGIVEYIVPKCSKDGLRIATIDDQICLSILQTKIVEFKFITTIIICTIKGIFVSLYNEK